VAAAAGALVHRQAAAQRIALDLEKAQRSLPWSGPGRRPRYANVLPNG